MWQRLLQGTWVAVVRMKAKRTIHIQSMLQTGVCVWVSVEDPKRCKNYTSWSATFDQQGDVAYNQGPRPTNLSCCIGCRADQLCVPAGCRFSRGKWPSQELPYRQFSVVVFDFARRKRNQTTMAGLDGFYDFQTFFGKPMEANMHYQQGSSLQRCVVSSSGPLSDTCGVPRRFHRASLFSFLFSWRCTCESFW